MFSVYDLTFAFIERHYNSNPAKWIKAQIKSDFEKLLAEGWNVDDIIKGVKRMVIREGALPYEMKNNSSNPSRGNLMAPNTFYYHNQLRIFPDPPRRALDYNTGEIIKIDTDHYLEMRASYTLFELSEYFDAQFGQTNSRDTVKRNIGGFSYLLKSNTLEEILFAIDAASNLYKSEDRNTKEFNPLVLKEWMATGKKYWWEKVTGEKESGDDRIVPRRRVLSFRSGHPV